ncbi:hypothetical protein WJX84_011153 [Apatococcus fuscideae]|uniref:Uncharacterized protein n=1 Tax=Apatococcus fuscideae TaxID=2026836 RepID=A0AAW1TJA0_9CHLO
MLLSAAANNRTSAIGSHRQACPFLAAAGSLARVDTFSNLPRAEGRVHKGSQNKRRRSSHSHLEPCKGLCPATHSSQRPCRDKHPLKGVCSAFWCGHPYNHCSTRQMSAANVAFRDQEDYST